ncbi:MAG: aminotransferase class III-fold pyridoxal phosphate-dependent enzyme, partial [Anaerolineae bacterium]|nr:aminotransferase class III-fold pyridoxal phosphate-dependent enzyme [Anaerolineae bacterium]
GGVPMGAVAWNGRQIEAGAHGSTFGGNPLACAAALASLNALRDLNAPERTAQVGGRLLDRLRAEQPASVREVRGLGLMIGLELKGRVTPVIQALQARGVLALVAGKTVLRLLPPLIITDEEADRLAETVLEVLRNDVA